LNRSVSGTRKCGEAGVISGAVDTASIVSCASTASTAAAVAAAGEEEEEEEEEGLGVVVVMAEVG
jgi:hypothetical protein